MADEIEVFEKNVKAIFEDMTALLVSKRLSYGPSSLLEDGGYGILIRASDKVSRLRNMYKNGTTHNDDGDSMFDAWRDLIGYAVLAILFETEERSRRQQEKLDNPPPGESYVKIDLPEAPIPGPYSVGEWGNTEMEFKPVSEQGVNYLIGNPVRRAPNSIDLEIKLDQVNMDAIKKMVDSPAIEKFDMTGFEGTVSFDGDEVEVNGVPMTGEQFTAVLKGMQRTPATQAYTRDVETPHKDALQEGYIVTIYQCQQCGVVALSMDDIAYDCHPFVREFASEVL